jgi:hypothetical protein
MEQLDTDSCRGTVPKEPPMPNCSMRHQNPVGDFDDTGHFLQGALCTIERSTRISPHFFHPFLLRQYLFKHS